MRGKKNAIKNGVIAPGRSRDLQQTTFLLICQRHRDTEQGWWQGRVDGYEGSHGRKGRAEEFRKPGSDPGSDQSEPQRNRGRSSGKSRGKYQCFKKSPVYKKGLSLTRDRRQKEAGDTASREKRLGEQGTYRVGRTSGRCMKRSTEERT